MDNLIPELHGSMAPVTDDFFSAQIREYSVVKSIATGSKKLWLSPAAFLNHDCEANTNIYSLGRIGHYRVNEQGAARIMSNLDCSEEVTERTPREAVYTCNMCGQMFLYKCWLGIHIASHMDPIHVCKDCDRVFNRKDNLKRHIRTVHEKVKHKCDICDAKFSTTHAKTRHINWIHSEEDTTVHCPKYPSTFSCQLNPQYHDNLKHTLLKPYECKECNQGFESPYFLQIHRKSYDKHRNDR
ncbi:zinc finger protein 888-like [Acyrthosiphon pisum]|uniref:C2H2-type domain-containing protein n=1 Tax=Acyrthosiphon pisum TaxID=7029 RepID=A0A8R2F789_ACYPI|nr:zinc finger protein 888-like [Acyrthosiphon pisum]|eukprot:XP_008181121.1 PREDICTED: zinc finger protein 888-like [Acyrthosiphon pisum]